jgi:hypothetical protein
MEICVSVIIYQWRADRLHGAVSLTVRVFPASLTLQIKKNIDLGANGLRDYDINVIASFFAVYFRHASENKYHVRHC